MIFKNVQMLSYCCYSFLQHADVTCIRSIAIHCLIIITLLRNGLNLNNSHIRMKTKKFAYKKYALNVEHDECMRYTSGTHTP